jgi:trimethylamine:corrinoid methyltransferase-like protein
MTATNERTGTRRISPSPGSTGGRSRHRRRHADAVIQAEVRRLARALGTYRVLQEDTLRRTARAASSRGVGFETATE